MKKFGVIALLTCVLSFSASAGVGKTILMWLPNRILDLTDIVSLGIGLGGVKAEARVTRAIDFSCGDSFNLMLRKDVNRHYGITMEQGYHVNFLYVGCEDYQIDKVVNLPRLSTLLIPFAWGYPVPDNGSTYNEHLPWRLNSSVWPVPGTDIQATYKPTFYTYEWLCSPADYGYDWKKGSRDWWEIGAEVSCGAAVRVAVHPLQIADFICGIFFFDLLDDDVVLK
ncbi:MAG: hypothetical protein MJ033_02095 [Victivallaceae bacterium]|nr:hypothetical protein [Victivallaceae bacterium]